MIEKVLQGVGNPSEIVWWERTDEIGHPDRSVCKKRREQELPGIGLALIPGVKPPVRIVVVGIDQLVRIRDRLPNGVSIARKRQRTEAILEPLELIDAALNARLLHLQSSTLFGGEFVHPLILCFSASPAQSPRKRLEEIRAALPFGYGLQTRLIYPRSLPVAQATGRSQLCVPICGRTIAVDRAEIPNGLEQGIARVEGLSHPVEDRASSSVRGPENGVVDLPRPNDGLAVLPLLVRVRLRTEQHFTLNVEQIVFEVRSKAHGFGLVPMAARSGVGENLAIGLEVLLSDEGTADH